MPAIVGFVQSCKWTQLSLFFLRGTLDSTATELSQLFFRSNVKVILSLSFDAVLQPGCDGGSADFPTRFLNNVSTLAQPA